MITVLSARIGSGWRPAVVAWLAAHPTGSGKISLRGNRVLGTDTDLFLALLDAFPFPAIVRADAELASEREAIGFGLSAGSA
jgi:hypothetical protein